MARQIALPNSCRTSDLAYLVVITGLALLSALAWLETHPSEFTGKRVATTSRSLLPAALQWDAATVDKLVVRLPAPPSVEHWLGTDDRGRDLLVRWISATVYSVSSAAVALLVMFAVAFGLGAMPQFLSLPFVRAESSARVTIAASWFHELARALATACRALPFFFLAAAVAETGTKGTLPILLLWGLFSWPAVARQIADWTRQWGELPHVSATVLGGVKKPELIVNHLLPYLSPRAFALAPRLALETIAAVTAMQFLGLGSGLGEPALAEMLVQFREYGELRFLAPPLLTLAAIWLALTQADRLLQRRVWGRLLEV